MIHFLDCCCFYYTYILFLSLFYSFSLFSVRNDTVSGIFVVLLASESMARLLYITIVMKDNN